MFIRYLQMAAALLIFLLILFGGIALATFILAKICQAITILFFPKKRKAVLASELKRLLKVIGSPGNRFRVSRNLKRNIRKRQDVEKNLKLLTESILVHMLLPPNSVTLYVVHSEFDSFSSAGVVGRYYSGEREIELMLRKDQKFWNIAAILTHECSHHFLDSKGVVAKPCLNAEELTDMTAIALGFGGCLDKGFHMMDTKNPYSSTVRTAKLGYLKYSDRLYIRWKILKYRKKSLNRYRAK